MHVIKGNMAKSRAQTQKEYRERKKAEGSGFLEKERKRQKKYRKTVSQMTSRELKRKRELNLIHCDTYRRKRKEITKAAQRIENGVESTFNDDNEPMPGTSAAFSPAQSPEIRELMTVQLPFQVRKKRKMIRSKALRKANLRIHSLEDEIKKRTSSEKKYQKRYERLKKKVEKENHSNTIQAANLTPKSKTHLELRSAGVSPRTLPKPVVRKLELANIIGEEIKDTLRKNPSKAKQNLIKNIVSGKIVKRYRCKSALQRFTGFELRHLKTNKTVELVNFTRNKAAREVLKKSVLGFLERDDISRCMPGKQDALKSEGEVKQVRILNDYLRNLHEKFQAENPGMKCSLALFCKLRPRHIKLTSLISRNTCLCTTHQNMAMKLKCLKSLNIGVGTNPEVVSQSVTEINMKSLLEQLAEQNVEYESWQRVDCNDGKKRMKIVKTSVTRQEFIQQMTREYKTFLGHVDRVKKQYRAVADLKSKLPPGHVIVQMDFAENFTCQSQDEIQSAYWNSSSVTLHPVVVYYKSDTELQHKNYVFVSDLQQHNAKAVTAILTKLVPLILSEITGTSHLHYWTDSPTSQYRNRYIFDLICRHEQLFSVPASWNYFEAGHGKGPCDGIGGAAKRQASEAVRQGKATIQDAQEFYNWAKSSERSIKYLFYSTEEYNTAEKILSARVVRPIPGTMKTHAVVPADATSLYIREVRIFLR